MSALLILATFQVAAYGPILPSSDPRSGSQLSGAGRCPEAVSNEIVVCKRQNSVPPQVGPVGEPAMAGALSFDESGKFRLDLGKGVLLHGGGPKGSACVGVNIAF